MDNIVAKNFVLQTKYYSRGGGHRRGKMEEGERGRTERGRKRERGTGRRREREGEGGIS